MTQKHTNNREQEKPNDFELKYSNQIIHNEKAELINNMIKELEGHKEDPKAEIHTGLIKAAQKNIKLENARL